MLLAHDVPRGLRWAALWVARRQVSIVGFSAMAYGVITSNVATQSLGWGLVLMHEVIEIGRRLDRLERRLRPPKSHVQIHFDPQKTTLQDIGALVRREMIRQEKAAGR